MVAIAPAVRDLPDLPFVERPLYIGIEITADRRVSVTQPDPQDAQVSRLA